MRPIESGDVADVLALNEANVELLAPLDGERLDQILTWADRALVIEGKVMPTDADDLSPGMETQVRFSALQERNLPILKGQLTKISADSFEDPRTGSRYFKIEAVVPPAELAKLALVVWGADMLTRKRKLLHQQKHLLIPLVPVAALVVGLVLLGGDLGTLHIGLGALGDPAERVEEAGGVAGREQLLRVGRAALTAELDG